MEAPCHLMFRLRFIVALLLLLLSDLAAFPPTARGACVWEVEGGRSPLFLAGSVHFLREQDTIPPVYDRVFAMADRVVFESDPASLADPHLLVRVTREGRYPIGDSIFNHISPNTAKALRSALAQLPGGSPLIEPLRPWLAAVTLGQLQLGAMGAHSRRGLDHVYSQRARQQGKLIAGLESPDAHIALLASLTAAEQEALLCHSLADSERWLTGYEAMIAAWQAGDQGALSSFFYREDPSFAPVMRRIVQDRNKKWLPTLLTYLQQDQTLMVLVGTAHLIGDSSVIDLLEKNGYNLRQLN